MTMSTATTPTLPATVPPRRADWPERLAAVIEAARHEPYCLGSHDCVRLAFQCIEAMTGADLWPIVRGYTTKAQAVRTMARLSGGSADLGDALTAVLGRQPQPVSMAQRGDVLLYQDEEGQHLGVCVGFNMVLLAERGLVFVPVSKALAAWRVG
jgi:hypothetical protein